jgi:hypothetical protein
MSAQAAPAPERLKASHIFLGPIIMDDNHHLANVTMLDHPDNLVTSIASAISVELTATRVLISTFLILTVASWVSTLRRRASLVSSTCCDIKMV